MRKLVATLIFGLIAGGAVATEKAALVEHFETTIRPLLVQTCYECHSAESGKAKGGLVLDTAAGWKLGGDSGAAIQPGNVSGSLLWRAISYEDPDLKMPPDGRLSDGELRAFKKWIEDGAVDPRISGPPPTKDSGAGIDLEKGRQFWAFRPILPPDIPNVSEGAWADGVVARFVLAKLAAANLSPAEQADPRTLVRRLYFDLIGLPPTPDQLHAYFENPSETRYEDLVESLLADAGFGEKWGRHWLDLARYADSTGGGRSSVLADAWRYRNYVIEAFNEDRPIDEFIQEQIAGDLMESDSPEERSRRIVAVGFLALGPKNLDLQDKELLRMNTVDEQMDTVGKTFLGLTLGCARCHDHKFDPIPAADYYAMAGIFRSTQTLVLGNVSTLVKNKLPGNSDLVSAHKAFDGARKKLTSEIARLKKGKADKALIRSREGALKDLEKQRPEAIPTAISVGVAKDAGDYHICVRGNPHMKGEVVPRGFLQVASPEETVRPSLPVGASGRLELAKWLTSETNPLTARVFVNRIWGRLMGAGIVSTEDNLGLQGSRPTHPDLLDYLASRFRDSGWSLKNLVRELVLSRTYRMSVTEGVAALGPELDPENTLLWRRNRIRIPAEALRDSLLAISGRLQLTRVDSALPTAARSDSALRNAKLDYPALVEQPFRSVYLPVFREEGRNGLLDAFDFANPSFTVGVRNESTIASQALYMMNSDFLYDCARASAFRFLNSRPRDEAPLERIKIAFEWVLSRPPRSEEFEIVSAFLTEETEQVGYVQVWTELFHSLFSCVEFRYLN